MLINSLPSDLLNPVAHLLAGPGHIVPAFARRRRITALTAESVASFAHSTIGTPALYMMENVLQ
jgi:hypothetical protein